MYSLGKLTIQKTIKTVEQKVNLFKVNNNNTGSNDVINIALVLLEAVHTDVSWPG